MSNRTESPIPLEMFTGEAKDFAIEVLDGDGNPESVEGKTLRFVVHDRMSPPAGEFKVEDGSISKSDNVATVTVGADQTTAANAHLAWELWDTDANEVLAHGNLIVKPAVKDV